MSDEPRKAVLSSIGVAALAAVILAGIRTETPFQQAVRQLRVGMSSAEARAAAQINDRKASTVAGGSYSYWVSYRDPTHRESLWLAFEYGDSDFRLVDWKLSRW
jgi:hypothetical protein